jgi:hypothetical protein
MASRWITIAAAAMAAFGGATRALAQEQDTFEWMGVVEPGKTLEVRGINGDITVDAAPGAAAQVRAVKHGEDDDPRTVRIEVVEDERGVLVCAVYPSSRDNRPNACTRDGHGQHVRDNDVHVDFDVKIPAGVRLVAGTVNGEIEARGVTADAKVSSVNGNVSVVTTGSAAASSVNGSVEATMGTARWDGTLAFQSVNGSVTIHLPAGTSAEVEGATVNGSLDSDFPLTLEAGRTWGPRKFEGRIGDGAGGKLEIETVNGSIELRRT